MYNYCEQQKNGLTITKLCHRYFPWKIFWMLVFKVFSIWKTIFTVDIKSLILSQLVSIGCLYYNIWTRIYQLYVLEESEVVAGKSFIEKMFLRILTGRNHRQIKLQRLQKVRTWTFRLLVHQINSYKRFLN